MGNTKKNIKAKSNGNKKAATPWGFKGCMMIVIAGLIAIIVIGIMSCIKFYENHFSVGV
ncbi:MAG: hypothetical protein MJZ15_09495 [Bacteroidales bacterium]|nr:hypothetical protein [Bacteroidales bacterium]